jgi:hypothetical protein
MFVSVELNPQSSLKLKSFWDATLDSTPEGGIIEVEGW